MIKLRNRGCIGCRPAAVAVVLKGVPGWNFGQKLIRFVFVIDAAAIVLHAIGNYQNGYLQRHVVSRHLVENFLVDLHFGSFALHNQYGIAAGLIHHNIAALGLPVIGKAFFNSNK